MSAIIKQLTDKEGANDLLPITNIKAVYDDAGNRLDNLLDKTKFRGTATAGLFGTVSDVNNTSFMSSISNTDEYRLFLSKTDLGYEKYENGALQGQWVLPVSRMCSISDAYNPSKAYARNEFCIYNNTLWKSKVDNNVGNTPSEGSYWTATNVGTVVSGISSDLSEKVGKNEVKNFINFNKVYPIGTSRLDMINDLANSLADGQGATFSVIINGDNWLFGFITKYDSTQNGGFMVDASGIRYSFTSLSGIIQI